MFFLQTAEPTSEPLLSFGFKKIQKVQTIYRVKTKQESTHTFIDTTDFLLNKSHFPLIYVFNIFTFIQQPFNSPHWLAWPLLCSVW